MLTQSKLIPLSSDQGRSFWRPQLNSPESSSVRFYKSHKQRAQEYFANILPPFKNSCMPGRPDCTGSVPWRLVLPLPGLGCMKLHQEQARAGRSPTLGGSPYPRGVCQQGAGGPHPHSPSLHRAVGWESSPTAAASPGLQLQWRLLGPGSLGP